jgi:hypothetical protein
LHVLRQRQHNGTGVGWVGQRSHRCGQRGQQRLGSGDPIEEPGHRPECVVHRRVCLDRVLQLLQYGTLATGGVRVARQQQHRQPVHGRQGRARHQIHRTRADRRGHRQRRLPPGRLRKAGRHVRQCLLVATLDERQYLAVLVQRLPEAGHIAVAEDAERSWHESSAVPVDDRVLPGQVRDEGLRNRQPHRARGCVLHQSISLFGEQAGEQRGTAWPTRVGRAG